MDKMTASEKRQTAIQEISNKVFDEITGDMLITDRAELMDLVCPLVLMGRTERWTVAVVKMVDAIATSDDVRHATLQGFINLGFVI